MILNAIISYVVILISIVLFTIVGYRLLIYIMDEEVNIFMSYGLSYFCGMTVFYSAYSLATWMIGNARIGMILTFSLLLFLVINKSSIILLKKTYITLAKRAYAFGAILSSLVLLQCYLLIFWLPPFVPPYLTMNVGQFLGSLHPGIFANIATFISTYNYIPVLSQKYGQALLATIPMFAGANNPYFALFLWLTFTISALIILTYGLFKHVGLKKGKSLLGTVIVLFGNFALSFKHLWIIDTGTPLLYLGYADSVASIGSFVVFLAWLKRLIDVEYFSVKYMIIPLVLGVSVNIFAPEIVPATMLLLFTVLFCNIVYKKKKMHELLPLLLGSICFIGAVLLGSMIGGMLNVTLDEAYNTYYLIPGTSKLPSKNIFVDINFPFYYLKSYDAFQYNGINWVYGAEVYSSITDIWWRVETIIWNSLRIIFFPLTGVITLFVYSTANKYNCPVWYAANRHVIENFSRVSMIVFFLGWTLVTFVCVAHEGFKWPMTRFLILGYYMGMVSLVISYYILVEKIQDKARSRLFLIGLVAVTTFGPLNFSVHVMKKNATAADLKERIKLLLTLDGMLHRRSDYKTNDPSR